MLIGVPKEIKNHEYRVGLTPESVAELHHAGHGILVEAGAGAGAALCLRRAGRLRRRDGIPGSFSLLTNP